jgi:hypothetical protein
MYVRLKKSVINVVLLGVLASFSDITAAPKTWSKDENGRVLIYRAEPSQIAGALLALMMVGGMSAVGMGLFSGKLENIVFGSIIAIPSGLLFKYAYYDEQNALYKPIVVIDKHGITFEGHAKMLWKNVCGYRTVENIIYRDGYTTHEYYLEISTDVDRVNIPENRLAITWQMLYKLVDEAYKSYQEMAKEQVIT